MVGVVVGEDEVELVDREDEVSEDRIDKSRGKS